MLFADAFWKPPTVYDVAGLVGLVLGVASIWVSWWLAKRDIEKRLDEAADRAAAAARDEVRRVARLLLHSGVTDAASSVKLAREACGSRKWPRASDFCQLACQQLTRAMAQQLADARTQTALREVSAMLLDASRVLQDQPKAGTGTLPEQIARSLDRAILGLCDVEGQLMAIRSEGV